MPMHRVCELQLSLLKKEFSNLGGIHAGYDSRGLEHIGIQNCSTAREMPGARRLLCKQTNDSEILRTNIKNQRGKKPARGPHR